MNSARSTHLALVLLVLLLGACAERATPVQEQQFLAFGTLVSVSLYDVDAARAAAAFDEIETLFNQLHRDWHAWEASPLTELNRQLHEHGEAEVPDVIQPLLEPAQRLSIQSGGLFNPAIGRLLNLWGFQSDTPATQPPAPEAIAATLALAPAMTDLQLEGTHLRTDNRAVQLDFGAFAKGVAVDRAIDALRARGIDNAIVNAGGDLRAIGRRGERAWRIGVRNPRGPGMLAVIETQGDESIFTSGDYERGFDFEGRHYHHILDPRSGYPATGASSVTVIHPDAAVADAAATALLVAGDPDWRGLARDLQLREVMLVDNRGNVHVTAAMAGRVKILLEPAPPLQVDALPEAERP